MAQNDWVASKVEMQGPQHAVPNGLLPGPLSDLFSLRRKNLHEILRARREVQAASVVWLPGQARAPATAFDGLSEGVLL